MYPPIFSIASSNAQVTALLGSSPTRLFPFGLAPQDVTLPYAVWQIITGSPENYINNTPDIDNFNIQIDVYGAQAGSVRAVAEALRNVIEPVAYITAWRGESIDFETKNYRLIFEVSWFVHR
jgi:hypothetical protein